MVRKIFNPKTINDYYQYAKQLLAEGKRDEARDALDFGIIKLAEINSEHHDDNFMVEGTRIALWLERYWYCLENNDLLLGQDDEELIELLKD
jgi:hypothetical protein